MPHLLPTSPAAAPQARARAMAPRGFTMVSMLFILVVLAALGVALASLSQRQQLGSAGELAAAKAYQAAYAGLEWGSFQVLRGGAQPPCFATRSFKLPDQLADFTVTVSCTRTPASGTVTDDGVPLAFYTLVATACNLTASGACPNATTTEPTYAERQLTRTLSP
ncbi:agglutinin biogenesis protein MshP [Pelomonas cellulosilytica]|uniref:Agglutinin biogenesis protein MshP n=1 Tax=Pelomonas cellulosilytica TaxID=2906762 RepID=A0ABS8XYQ3_9BURK|nr:agglutinin biogenesis protein MshP [Pelomonas sp. P8]MCE4555869.1 agglutinin biogenesis protein MshP [Pelomonas sp. P8]